MTEPITIDGLPEGYYVMQTKHSLWLKSPLPSSVIKSFALDVPPSIVRSTATEHEGKVVARKNAARRRAAEITFCKTLTNEQLTNISAEEMLVAICRVGACADIGDYEELREIAYGVIDKLTIKEVNS